MSQNLTAPPAAAVPASAKTTPPASAPAAKSTSDLPDAAAANKRPRQPVEKVVLPKGPAPRPSAIRPGVIPGKVSEKTGNYCPTKSYREAYLHNAPYELQALVGRAPGGSSRPGGAF